MTSTATTAQVAGSTVYDLDNAAAARYLKCDPTWLKRQALAGRITHTKLGRQNRYSKADLDEFIARHRREATERSSEQARPGMSSVSPATRARQGRGRRPGTAGTSRT
jgi:excisionase family DNA binding protein